jgi:hypothetical protein
MKRIISEIAYYSSCLCFTVDRSTPRILATRSPVSQAGFRAAPFFYKQTASCQPQTVNSRTNNLGGPADTHDEISGLASIYLRYQFEGGTSAYVGNPLEVGEGLALAAGGEPTLG